MECLWDDLVPVVTTLSGVIVGGLLNYWLGVMKSAKETAAARRVKEREASARLTALVELVWLELATNIVHLSSARSARDLMIDTSLWRQIRVDLRQAGLDGKITLSLMATYQLAEKWNSLLLASGYSETMTSGVAGMTKALLDTANLLEPLVSPQLIAKTKAETGT